MGASPLVEGHDAGPGASAAAERRAALVRSSRGLGSPPEAKVRPLPKLALWPARPRRADQSCVVSAGHRSLVHGELLAQREVLQGELAVAAERNGKSRRRWSRRLIIEPGSSPDESRQINHLPAGRSFDEGQVTAAA